ncbi:26891_t:CDS:1, partial [Racocetra persica]
IKSRSSYLSPNQKLLMMLSRTLEIEAGKYYKKRKEEDSTNQLIEALTYKIHQMATNYEKLTTTLIARVDVNFCPKQNRPSQPQQTPNSSIEYYNCRERDYIARNCLTERSQTPGRLSMNSNSNISQPRNVNLCDIYTQETEEGLYIIKH